MIHKYKSHTVLKRPLTAKPKQFTHNLSNSQSNNNNNRQTLNHVIPDMPAFINTNQSSTALLYSKFIMKGIKTNKIDLVKESFNMKKQNFKQQKKMSLNFMKTIRSTRNSSKNQALKSIRNQPNQRAQFLHRNSYNDDSKILNLQINNFFKINSNNNTNEKQFKQNQTDRKLTYIQSQKNIQRPKSAVTSPYTCVRNSRAHTANHKRFPSSANRQTLDYDDFKASIPERNLFKIIQSQRPGFGFTNFIERNKRQLSSASKKTSIYLTGIDGNKVTQNLTKEIKKIPAKKYQQALKCHALKKSMPDMNEQNEFDLDRKDERLSQQQIEDIKNINKENALFMKKNMPNQYKKFVQYLVMKQNNFTQKDKMLLSVNLQHNSNEFGEINLNSKNQQQAMDQARDYFNQYAHICEQTQYYINKNLKKKQLPKSFNQVLHVQNCRELIQLEKQKNIILKSNTQLSVQQINRLKQIKLRIYQIVKILSFFKIKSQKVCQKIFQLDFYIRSLQENQTIIHRGDQINHFYVILNGSVSKNSRNQNNDQFQTILTNPQNAESQTYTNTIFDGQSFGQTDNQHETKHRHQYKSAQKVLLLTFSYFEYRKICSQSQNIQDRILLLKDIFGSVPGCKSLNNQNLEALAFQLESSSFDAKNIIFRKADICDKLIIIASGKISKVNQHILKRQKKNSQDIKKKKKSASKLKIKNYSVQKLRRNNLKNYEVLTQNQEEFIFYYQDISKQLIRGDVINWEGFSYNYRQNLMDHDKSFTNDNNFKDQNLQSNNFPYKLEYSLISNTDNTKIYTLNLKRIQKLPELLKEVIYTKIDDAYKKQKKPKKSKIQPQKPNSIQKWDEYKQKICNDILSRKLKV